MECCHFPLATPPPPTPPPPFRQTPARFRHSVPHAFSRLPGGPKGEGAHHSQFSPQLRVRPPPGGRGCGPRSASPTGIREDQPPLRRPKNGRSCFFFGSPHTPTGPRNMMECCYFPLATPQHPPPPLAASTTGGGGWGAEGESVLPPTEFPHPPRNPPSFRQTPARFRRSVPHAFSRPPGGPKGERAHHSQFSPHLRVRPPPADGGAGPAPQAPLGFGRSNPPSGG
eukprot:gene16792-biopygen17285